MLKKPQNVETLENILTKELERYAKEKDSVLVVGLGNRHKL